MAEWLLILISAIIIMMILLLLLLLLLSSLYIINDTKIAHFPREFWVCSHHYIYNYIYHIYIYMKPEKTQVLRNLEGHQSIRTKEPFENHHGVSRDLPAEKAFLLLFFFEKA